MKTKAHSVIEVLTNLENCSQYGARFLSRSGKPTFYEYREVVQRAKAEFISGWIPICASGLLLMACWSVPGDGALARAASGELHDTRVAASDEPLIAQCNYKIWIPKETPLIRSIFVINMRAAGKHLFYKDPEWRTMASRNDSAVLYCEFEAHGVRDNGQPQQRVALVRPKIDSQALGDVAQEDRQR